MSGSYRALKVAAVQLESKLGDVAANLLASEQLVVEAAEAGAEWIVLPEFFTTGMGFTPEMANAALPARGRATELLVRLSKRYHAKVCGSFLCRDEDGHVRNAFFLATPEGLAGRHDKDIPTLWENCWYIGGSDDGVLEVEDLTVGAALCLEFARSQTARRLRGVDLVVGGSCTWHAPDYLPKLLGREQIDRRLFSDLSEWAAPFARLVGAPVVEATHCGMLDCRDQLLPIRYRSRLGVGAKICAADGTVLAARLPDAGPGFAMATVEAGAVEPMDPLPERFWLRSLGLLGTSFWHLQSWHGRRWYRRQRSAARDRASS